MLRYRALLNTLRGTELKKALDLLTQSVAQNNVDAAVLLAELSDSKTSLWKKLGNDSSELQENLPLAFTLNQKAAQQGSPVSMDALGLMYARGRGTPIDMNNAVTWLDKACRAGNLAGNRDLSTLLMYGGVDGNDLGCPKDVTRAYILARAYLLVINTNSDDAKDLSKISLLARQTLSPDQLIADETEAQSIATKIREANSPKQSEVIASQSMDKESWKAILAKFNPTWAAGGKLVVQKGVFLDKFGKPTRTETEEGTVYWYYECTDGTIQLELNETLLSAGLVSGQVNDN